MLEDVKKVRAKIPNIFLPLMGPHMQRVGSSYVHIITGKPFVPARDM